MSLAVSGELKSFDWGLLLVLGLFAGAFAAALFAGEFRIRVPDAQTSVKAVIGGLLMGFGASLAGGCTVGNGMVQTSLFTYQGWVALVAMTGGVYVGTKLWVKPSRAAVAHQTQTYDTNQSVEQFNSPLGVSGTDFRADEAQPISGQAPSVPTSPFPVAAVRIKTAPKPGAYLHDAVIGRFRLNQLGAVCPFPLVETKAAMEKQQPGQSLVIEFDCTQATDAIPRWAAVNNYKVDDFIETGPATWQITVTKS